MQMKILLIVGILWMMAVCNARPADAEYEEYVDEPAPPPPPKPTRANLLKNRRNPLTARVNGKTASSTTTTPPPPPPVEESEIDDVEGGEDEEAGGGPASSTTEVPKKFKTGSVRPFRSNDDLLAALKRRREQAASNKPAAKTTPQEDAAATPDAAPSAANKNRVTSGGRKRFNHNKPEALPSNAEESVAAPSTPARTPRRFSPRA